MAIEFPATVSLRNRPDWGAIWSGTFCIYAIWAVFGALGLAIFASARSTNTVGMSIWSVVLTCIACYVGGHVAGSMAGPQRRHWGTLHGLIVFGLAVTGAIVLVSLAGAVLSGGQGPQATTPANGWTAVANLGWGGFVSLLLGWIFAMLGGAAGAGRTSGRIADRADVAATTGNTMRPAA